MSNRRKNRKANRGAKKRIFGRALNQTKLAANVTEEQDWYLDTPDVRLARIFSVVLILHVVAVGGILAFKMIDKASVDSGVQFASASTTPNEVVKQQATLAGKATQQKKAEIPAAKPKAKASVPPAKVASPLDKDPEKPKQYRVLAGDTLAEIAKTLSIDPAILRAENSIRSDNELYPGRWLDIPSKENVAVNKVGSSSTQKAATPSAMGAEPKALGNQSPEAASSSVYVVQSGDTVWGISRKFSISYQELVTANGVANPQSLQIGQTLNIPAKK